MVETAMREGKESIAAEIKKQKSSSEGNEANDFCTNRCWHRSKVFSFRLLANAVITFFDLRS